MHLCVSRCTNDDMAANYGNFKTLGTLQIMQASSSYLGVEGKTIGNLSNTIGPLENFVASFGIVAMQTRFSYHAS